MNPGFILGPMLETDVGTSGALIQKMLKGSFPGSPDLYFSYIDVRDAATMHINAMQNADFAGRRCLAAGPALPFRELALGLAEDFPEFAKKLPTRKLPDFIVRIVGLFDGDTKSAVKMLGRVHHNDSIEAEKLLGKPLKNDRTAARDMAQSIVDFGLV